MLMRTCMHVRFILFATDSDMNSSLRVFQKAFQDSEFKVGG